MGTTFRRWAILVRMQIKLLLRNRSALIGSLGLAVVSMLIFGSLLGGGSSPLAIAIVDQDGSAVAAQVIAAFERTAGVAITTPCPTCDAVGALKRGDVAAVVVLPAGFARDVAAGQATAQVYYDGSNPMRGGQV